MFPVPEPKNYIVKPITPINNNCTQKNANPQTKNMKSEVEINCLFTVIGAVVGVIGSYFIARYQRKRDAKDTFLVFISQSRFRVKTILRLQSGRDFQGFYVQSRAEIADAIARVRPFLNCCNQSRIDGLWGEYDQIPQEELDTKFEDGWEVEFEKTFTEKKQPIKPSKRLLRFLDEFERIAG